MNQNNNVHLSIEEAKTQIARGEALERLLNNPDFALLIGEVYYKEEPARLAGLLGDIGGSYRWVPGTTAMSLPPKEFVKMTEDIQRDLHAVGALQAFLRVVSWKAEMSRNALDELEAERDGSAGQAEETTEDFPEA